MKHPLTTSIITFKNKICTRYKFAVTFILEYTRQRSSDCVGVPRLPPSTPRTSKRSGKSVRAREREGGGENSKKEKRGGRRKATVRDQERRSVCSARSWTAHRAQRRRTRVCSVFRMHGTSAACPRPPELWSLSAHPACTLVCPPACLLLTSCLPTSRLSWLPSSSPFYFHSGHLVSDRTGWLLKLKVDTHWRLDHIIALIASTNEDIYLGVRGEERTCIIT